MNVCAREGCALVENCGDKCVWVNQGLEELFKKRMARDTLRSYCVIAIYQW
jgi:hypothetical protein